MKNINIIMVVGMLLLSGITQAQDNTVLQTTETDSLETTAQMNFSKISCVEQEVKIPTLELFMGADLAYRDMNWYQVYEMQLRLTPGLHINIGKGWKISGQASVPVANWVHGKADWTPRLNIAAISKELNLKSLNMKVSAGHFSRQRYGVDLKAMYDIYNNNAFAISAEAQIGCTGAIDMINGWHATYMQRITAVGGADLYLNRYNTQIRVRGGRFLCDDYGAIGEVIRHFTHCSVGVYAQSSTKYESTNGGFKVVMMIPPYTYKKHHKVLVRPASNFRLTYNMRGDGLGCKMYDTDPEENERNSWFDANSSRWEKKGGNK